MQEISSPVAKKIKIDSAVNSQSSTEKENGCDESSRDDDHPSECEIIAVTTTPGTKRKRAELDRIKKNDERERLKREKEETKLRLEQMKLEEKERKEVLKRQKELEREREEFERKERRRLEEEQARVRREEIRKMKEEAAARKIAEQEEKRRKRLAEEEERQKKKHEKEEEARKVQEEKRKALESRKKESDERKRQVEEKRRLEEEKKKRLDEENERQIRRQSALLMSFVQKEEKSKPKFLKAPKDHWLFSDFEIKEGMSLAPVHRRRSLGEAEKDAMLQVKLEKSNYLENLSKKKVGNTRPNKAKYFHFHENYRPPYYGTWRKRSKMISGRRPFVKEEGLVDYDYDSDEEWEGEQDVEADECKSDEEEDDMEAENSEDEDGFFVEHGYLSNDEGASNECDRPVGETEDQRKQRLEERAREWKVQQKVKESRHKKKQLVPTQIFDFNYDNISESARQLMQRGIVLVYTN